VLEIIRKWDGHSFFDFDEFLFGGQWCAVSERELWFAGSVDAEDFFLLFFGFEEEVLDGDIYKVSAAEEFDDFPAEEEAGCGDSDDAEHEGADETIGEGTFLLVFGNAACEQSQHECVIDGEYAFEEHQQANDADVATAEGLVPKPERHTSGQQ
jgi:hypothetical protein